MTPQRQHLPNRRDNRHATVELNGQQFNVCIGLDPATGRPHEVFLNSDKNGSQFAAVLADVATALSVSLQFGTPLQALAKSMGRAPNVSTMPGSVEQLAAGSQPASFVGAVLDLLIEHEPRPDGGPSSE